MTAVEVAPRGPALNGLAAVVWFVRRHPAGSITGSINTRGANFLFNDMHGDFRTFQQWMDNVDELIRPEP